MALNKDWKDLPASLAPAAGEMLADWHARINAYEVANPGVLTYLSAAAMEDVETRAQAELDTKASGADLTSLSVRVDALSAVSARTASYTPVLADANKLLTMDSANAEVFTIPANASVGYAVGTTLEFARFGAGAVTITPAAGVTMPNSLDEAGTTSRTITSRRTSAVATKVATDTWWLTGSIS